MTTSTSDLIAALHDPTAVVDYREIARRLLYLERVAVAARNFNDVRNHIGLNSAEGWDQANCIRNALKQLDAAS